MNAKEELLRLLNNCNKTLKCAQLQHGGMWEDDEDSKHYTLKVDHKPTELQSFLTSLDFNYDAGYGGQELFGILWFDDDTYADRHEYDGSECWDVHELPEIPDQCK